MCPARYSPARRDLYSGISARLLSAFNPSRSKATPDRTQGGSRRGHGGDQARAAPTFQGKAMREKLTSVLYAMTSPSFVWYFLAAIIGLLSWGVIINALYELNK